ncbi:MAG: methyltransferase domain-containing protein, partial [Myxococcota bacterium]
IWDRASSSGGSIDLSMLVQNLGLVFVIMVACIWSFVGIGQAVGHWLGQGAPLQMYTADIVGSMIGVSMFGLVSYLGTPPQVWLCIAVALLGISGWLWSPADRRYAIPLVVLLAVAGLDFANYKNSASLIQWSPYYRIAVRDAALESRGRPALPFYQLFVNRDIHQNMIDVADEHENRFDPNSDAGRIWAGWRFQYDFPYLFKKRPQSVLIGGAGSGNNAASALRNGAQRITAVEIDAEIINLGRAMHPERPYDSGRIKVVINDIRSFLRWSDEKFDLIEYGILDSHTALSALSSLRLENYVYTVEGIRDAYRHLAPGGVMCVSFYEADREWLAHRMFENIEQAIGSPPLATKFNNQSFFVFGPDFDVPRARAMLRSMGSDDLTDAYAAGNVKPSTDDWPFLYSKPSGQPFVYYLSLAALIAGAVWFVHRILRAGGDGVRLDVHMFLLGAGFLLIETKGLAELSLLFGSTWIVNTLVFFGIFSMVLLSVWASSAGWGAKIEWAYVLLIAVLIGWYVFPREVLSGLPFGARASVGTLLVVLPLFFAGIVFATSFAKRKNASLAFGSNLIGAVIGGAAEAASIAWGIRSLTLLALAFYVASWIAHAREH